MKSNNIEYFKKQNYGRIDLYIKDPTIAKAVYTITGKKTLSENIKKGFEMLGITFTEVLQPL